MRAFEAGCEGGGCFGMAGGGGTDCTASRTAFGFGRALSEDKASGWVKLEAVAAFWPGSILSLDACWGLAGFF